MDIKELDRELCGRIWSCDSMGDLLSDIASSGHRFTGSAGERKAQKIIMERMRSWGIETRFHRFRTESWVRGNPELSVPGAGAIPCEELIFSGSTGGKPRKFQVVDLFDGTPGDFERNKGRIRGKAVLFSRKDYEEMNRPAGFSRIKAALEEGAKAFVMGSYGLQGAVSTFVLKVRDYGPVDVPAVSVSAESAETIRRAMRNGGGRISLSTSGRNVSRYTGNVEGIIRGRRNDNEIILGAHLDSFDVSPGADDNGSGVAVVCEVARLLAGLRTKPGRTVRFAFFTGEELGRVGSEKYASGIVDGGNAGVYFNFDLPANGGYPHLLAMTGRSDPDFWAGLMDRMNYRFRVKEINSRASDHYSFYRRGIPAIWEIADKSGTRGPSSPHHTAHDTLEYVNPNELKEAATMAVKIVLYLASVRDFPFERFEPAPEESEKTCTA